MATPVIITIDILREHRPITANIDAVTFDAYAREAQDQELKNILGQPYYKFFIEAIDGGLPPIEEDLLFEGGEYTNNSNQIILFRGVAAYLSYATYARLAVRQNSQMSRFGVVTKTVDESTPQSAANYNQERNDARAVQMDIQKEIVRFLNDNTDDYPLYLRKDTRSERQAFKMFKVPRRVMP